MQKSIQNGSTEVGKKKTLNICVVHPNRNAYSETFIRNHIKYLAGNIFEVYGGWFPAFDKNDQRLADYFIKRSFTAKAIIVLCKLLPAFIANRIPSVIKGYPYNEDLNEKSFRFFLKKNKVDIVLAEFMSKGSLVKDVCNDLRIPFVVHTHGGGDIMNNEHIRIFSKWIPDMLQTAARVISVDSYSSSKLLEMGLQKEKLVEIGLGIDLELFKVTKPSANDVVFLAVGRLVNMKAPYLTILAFSSVVKSYPQAKLVMAGAGDLLDCCIQIVKALKIESNVIFPGVITPLEVADYMSKSRAFVQHSIHSTDGGSEGLPVAVLEAMATGLPVISTFHNGIADTIIHGEDGLLVNENDINAMADCMIRLIEEPFFADELGKKARRKIEQNFEMSKVTGDLALIINDAYSEYRSL